MAPQLVSHGPNQCIFLPAIVEELGELLHYLCLCLYHRRDFPCDEVQCPQLTPLLICQADGAHRRLLPLVPLLLPAVLHQQLRHVRAHHGPILSAQEDQEFPEKS